MSKFTIGISQIFRDEEGNFPILPRVGDCTGTKPPGTVTWDSAKEVPLPSRPIKVGEKDKMTYQVRVMEVQESKTILDLLGPDDAVRLRVGGRGFRNFRECKASEGRKALQEMVAELVEFYGDSTWFLHDILLQDILWVKTGGVKISWACYGDEDSSGGRSLEPVFDGPIRLSQVELLDEDPDHEVLDYCERLSQGVKLFLSRFEAKQ